MPLMSVLTLGLLLWSVGIMLGQLAKPQNSIDS